MKNYKVFSLVLVFTLIVTCCTSLILLKTIQVMTNKHTKLNKQSQVIIIEEQSKDNYYDSKIFYRGVNNISTLSYSSQKISR